MYPLLENAPMAYPATSFRCAVEMRKQTCALDMEDVRLMTNSSHFGPKSVKEINELKGLSSTSRKYSSGGTCRVWHHYTISPGVQRGRCKEGWDVPGRKHLAITFPAAAQIHLLCRGTTGANHTHTDRREPERILYKAEATGGFLDLVQTHDNSLDIPALGKELLDLLLGGVEGQVADIQRGGNLQRFLLQLPATLRAQRARRGLSALAVPSRRPVPSCCPLSRTALSRPQPSPPRPGPATRRAGRTRKCWSRYWLISQYESLLSPLSVVCSSPDIAPARAPPPGSFHNRRAPDAASGARRTPLRRPARLAAPPVTRGGRRGRTAEQPIGGAGVRRQRWGRARRRSAEALLPWLRAARGAACGAMAGPRVAAVEGAAGGGLSLLDKCRHWRLILG